MRSDVMMQEIRSTKPRKDSTKLLTSVVFQQFINTKSVAECAVTEHTIPTLNTFEPLQSSLITTACFIEQDGVAATFCTCIQEVLG
jgi:hypothetical protein